MNKDTSFIVSENIVFKPPKPRPGYPIAIDDWEYLKNKINLISNKPGVICQSIGAIFWGATITTFLRICINDFPKTMNESMPPGLKICWIIVLTTFLLGCTFIFLAHEQRKTNTAKTSDVLEHMKLIEKRHSANQENNMLFAEELDALRQRLKEI